jgi:predicted DNA-binding protein
MSYPVKRVCLLVPVGMWERVKAESARQDRKPSQYVRRAIAHVLANDAMKIPIRIPSPEVVT